MSPTVAELRQFVAVVRQRSFTRAAAEAHISQPALSRSIAALERDAGVSLLRRTTRSVEPTPEGVEFAAAARAILKAYDDGLGRFGAYLSGLSGRVVVAALPSLAAGPLPPIIARFAETHPDVEVRIREGLDREVRQWIDDGSADLGLSDAGRSRDGVVSTDLGDDPMVAVFHPDSALAHQTSVTWRELAEMPFVGFSEGSSVRRLTDLGFDAVARRPSRLFEAVAISTVAGMIAARLGVTAVPRSVVPLMGFTPLATRPLVAPVIRRRTALQVRRHPGLPPAAHDLAALIREVPIPC